MTARRGERRRVRLKSFADLGEPRLRMAIHEAGHAVVDHHVGAVVEEVSIQYHASEVLDGLGFKKVLAGNGGYTQATFCERTNNLTNRAATLYAGVEAEQWFGWTDGRFPLSDVDALLALFNRVLERHPDQRDNISKHMVACRRWARQIIGYRWEDVQRVADALVRKGTLDRDAFLGIMRQSETCDDCIPAPIPMP
jgi:hypothetical protein